MCFPSDRLAILWAIVAAVMPVLVTGCNRGGDSGAPDPASLSQYAALAGLRASDNPELQTEWAIVVEQNGTPEQLAAEVASQQAGQSDSDVTSQLAALIDPGRLGALLDQAARLWPPIWPADDPVLLGRMARFRQGNDRLRMQVRRILSDTTAPLPVRFDLGFAADLSFVDVLRLAARLEALYALERLVENDLPPAVAAWQQMMDIARRLAAVKHPVARLEGAYVRAEALELLERLVTWPDLEDPLVDRAALAHFCRVVSNDLENWPDDAGAWIGDRALGLHAYELVREGRAAALLTEKDRQGLAEQRLLVKFSAIAQRGVDADELFYLKTMRKIIESSSRPYSERRALFADLRQELHRRRNDPDFPIVAGRLLLPDIEKGHIEQARDRARMEAWALALAAGAGLSPPEFDANPLSGEPYEVTREDGAVHVRWTAFSDLPEHFVVVPELAPGDSAE